MPRSLPRDARPSTIDYLRAMLGRRTPLLLVFVLAACGARTELDLDRFAVERPDASLDAQRPECVRDRDCDDGIECTDDLCVRGSCQVRPVDARCEDDSFCNGPPNCAVGVGCVLAPVVCNDGVSCTVDACDERARACTSQPDVGLCPISHRCDPVLDCVARALVHDDEALHEVDLPSGARRRIAPLDVSLTDLALHPDGRLFGVNRDSLYLIDETTGRATWLANIRERLVALEVGPDGALYGAGPTEVVRIDPRVYAVRRIGVLPPGVSASGDVAFVGGRLYITATRVPFSTTVPDILVWVPGDEAPVVEIGSTGIACIWALAPIGDTLYGLTCTGQLAVRAASCAPT
jgi:hypothetical protein